MRKLFHPGLLVVLALLIPVGCGTQKNLEEGKPARASERRISMSKMSTVRRAAVAGSFYPGKPDELAREVKEYLGGAKPKTLKGSLAGLICPHAGYPYSGPVAAVAYKLLEGKKYETVILLGPSHHVGFEGAAVYESGSFETPLGNVEIDHELAKRLIACDPLFLSLHNAHSREHSLEVQLPFLQVTLKNFKIVPILLYRPSLEECKKIAGCLAKTFQAGKTLFIFSTDLSHYHPYSEAKKMDERALRLIENVEPESLYREMEKGSCELCGDGPVLAGLFLMKELGAKAEILHYANSGDTAGDRSQVVGYAAVAFSLPKTGNQEKSKRQEASSSDAGKQEYLGAQEKELLLKMARQTLEEYLKSGKIPEFPERPPALNAEYGMFVTLRKGHHLRGCIGYVFPREPLYRAVVELAISSATKDPRFPPMKYDELKGTKIEISIMSPLKRVENVEELEMGRHGVYVKKGWASGLFLPQVATETGWSREEFLSHLCRDKAGLPADAWKDKSTEIYSFTADIFEEK